MFYFYPLYLNSKLLTVAFFVTSVGWKMGFVSRRPVEAEAAAESFGQAFEQTAPSEESRNVSENIQPINGSSFVPRGLAKEEVAVESLSQDVEPPSGCSNAMPPLEVFYE